MAYKKYRLTADFVVPAGHTFLVAPPGLTRKIYVPFVEADIPMDEDRTAVLSMPLEEALQLGIVEEITDEPA